jgi:starch synthase
VFHQTDYWALDSALGRALGLWHAHPEEFRKLIINGMRYDYSWNHPGHHYLSIYHHIRHK